MVLTIPGFSQEGEPGMADIFFLDLGIVIEPATGNETFSRKIDRTSEEVQFKIKKVKSGSVYLAASQEMMDALSRIQERMDRLEQSFQHQMNSLSEENRLLRNTISNISADLVQKETETTVQKKPDPEPEPEKEVIAAEKNVSATSVSRPAVVKQVREPVQKEIVKPTPFSMTTYMSGLFAYEREEYGKAIKIFNSLNLEGASVQIVENVLYWKADGFQQLGEHEKALNILNEILALENGIRKDDALIKRGLMLRKQGHEEQALRAFGSLIEQFPESEYARLAQLELNKAEKLQ